MTIGIVVVIAIERYVLIVYATDSSFIEGIFKHIFVAIDIGLVIATVIPYTAGLNIEEFSGRCIQFEGKRRELSLPYHWFVMITYSLVPVCIISRLYSKINKKLSNQATISNLINNGALRCKNMRQNRRIVYVTTSILLCFVLCTFPTRAILIYMEMKDIKDIRIYSDNDKDLYFVLTFISYVTYSLQSTIYPILYGMFDKECRKEIKKVLKL